MFFFVLSFLFSSFSTLIHNSCTGPASCSACRRGLPSQECPKFLPKRPPEFRLRRADAETSTAKPLISFVSFEQERVNRGIRTANTTSCALYLTHPIRGGTFTTAVPLGHPRATLDIPPRSLLHPALSGVRSFQHGPTTSALKLINYDPTRRLRRESQA